MIRRLQSIMAQQESLPLCPPVAVVPADVPQDVAVGPDEWARMATLVEARGKRNPRGNVAAGRGTEQFAAKPNSWRVVDRFLLEWTHLNAAARPGSSAAAIKPRISAIISSHTVGIFSYCMSHCRFEGGNIPSDWNSIPVGNEKCIFTVKYQVV